MAEEKPEEPAEEKPADAAAEESEDYSEDKPAEESEDYANDTEKPVEEVLPSSFAPSLPPLPLSLSVDAHCYATTLSSYNSTLLSSPQAKEEVVTDTDAAGESTDDAVAAEEAAPAEAEGCGEESMEEVVVAEGGVDGDKEEEVAAEDVEEPKAEEEEADPIVLKAKQVMAEMDANNSGHLNYKEFERFYEKVAIISSPQ